MIAICPKCQKEINTTKHENIYCNYCKNWINYNFSSINTTIDKTNEMISKVVSPYHKILPLEIMNKAESMLKKYKKLNESMQNQYLSQIIKILMIDLIHSTDFNEKIPYLYIRLYLKIKTDFKIFEYIESEYKKTNDKYIRITNMETIILHNIIGLRKIYSRYNCRVHIYPLLLRFYKTIYAKNINFDQYLLPSILFNSNISIFKTRLIKKSEICTMFNFNETTFNRNLNYIDKISLTNKDILIKLLKNLFQIQAMENQERIDSEYEIFAEDNLLNWII